MLEIKDINNYKSLKKKRHPNQINIHFTSPKKWNHLPQAPSDSGPTGL